MWLLWYVIEFLHQTSFYRYFSIDPFVLQQKMSIEKNDEFLGNLKPFLLKQSK